MSAPASESLVLSSSDQPVKTISEPSTKCRNSNVVQRHAFSADDGTPYTCPQVTSAHQPAQLPHQQPDETGHQDFNSVVHRLVSTLSSDDLANLECNLNNNPIKFLRAFDNAITKKKSKAAHLYDKVQTVMNDVEQRMTLVRNQSDKELIKLFGAQLFDAIFDDEEVCTFEATRQKKHVRALDPTKVSILFRFVSWIISKPFPMSMEKFKLYVAALQERHETGLNDFQREYLHNTILVQHAHNRRKASKKSEKSDVPSSPVIERKRQKCN